MDFKENVQMTPNSTILPIVTPAVRWGYSCLQVAETSGCIENCFVALEAEALIATQPL